MTYLLNLAGPKQDRDGLVGCLLGCIIVAFIGLVLNVHVSEMSVAASICKLRFYVLPSSGNGVCCTGGEEGRV